MKQKIWAYLMHLSENTWVDPDKLGECYLPEMKMDYEIWKDTVAYLPTQGFNTVLIDVGDAIQYESHPEISVTGAWTKDQLRAELDRIRALGLNPLPKLNFSASHNAWLAEHSRKFSLPEYYAVCEDVIKEVYEVFGNPEYFHLGLNEEKCDDQKYMPFSVIRSSELWWHDAYKLFDVCDKLGVRPWVWSDRCLTEADAFVKKMPKSVLQSVIWNNPIGWKPYGDHMKPTHDAFSLLDEHGFDQIPTTSTYNGNHLNSRETVMISKDRISDDKLLGFMTAPWHFERQEKKYFLRHDAAHLGSAKQEFYPEGK